jgi:hypothetical protein
LEHPFNYARVRVRVSKLLEKEKIMIINRVRVTVKSGCMKDAIAFVKANMTSAKRVCVNVVGDRHTLQGDFEFEDMDAFAASFKSGLDADSDPGGSEEWRELTKDPINELLHVVI